ncbi:MAG: glycoside hydrolase family 28 protein [Planctomycetota bacterium]|jgi:hypothetical protein
MPRCARCKCRHSAAVRHPNATRALQDSIDRCHEAGGGVVRVPAGTDVACATLRLRDNVELHLESGATLRASADHRDFDPCIRWLGSNRRAWITADGAENIAITGGGVLDGSGLAYMESEGPFSFAPRGGRSSEGLRPNVVALTGCRRVRIHDICIRDAAHFSIFPIGCVDVVIRGVSILNNIKIPNCDGIDLDRCRDVRISDCRIEAGDDAIALYCSKENPEYGHMQNVLIHDCVLRSGSTGIMIGTIADADIRNVIVSSCIIHDSNRGLAINLRDRGTVEDVLYSDLRIETHLYSDQWWGKGEPISLSAYPWHAGDDVGEIRRIHFRNVHCEGENGVFVHGGPQSALHDIEFDAVHVGLRKSSRWDGGVYDIRPYAEGKVPESHRPAGVPVETRFGALARGRTHGFYLGRARAVTLRNCSVTWRGDKQPFWGKALEHSDVEGLTVDGFGERWET